MLYGAGLTYLTYALFSITKLSARSPIASHAAAAPTWFALLLFILSVIYCLTTTNRLRFLGRLGVVAATYFFLIVIGAPLTDSVLDKNAGKLQVLFFDVGQGDCILLHAP